jgi:hypothetical protein
VGSRVKLILGKTFFFGRIFNLRIGAGAGRIESFTDGESSPRIVALIESGLVFYL